MKARTWRQMLINRRSSRKTRRDNAGSVLRLVRSGKWKVERDRELRWLSRFYFGEAQIVEEHHDIWKIHMNVKRHPATPQKVRLAATLTDALHTANDD